MLYVWIIFAIIFNAVGEYQSKKWAMSHSFRDAVNTFLAYMVPSVCWLGMMKYKNQLFMMSIVWQIVCCVLSAIIGLWLFNEKLTQLQWVGVAMGVVAAFLIIK